MKTVVYLTLCLCAALSHSSLAELITIQASGHLQSVEGVLRNEFSAGDAFSFIYTYDSEATDVDPSEITGSYWEAVQSGSLSIKNYSLTFDGGRISIINDFSGNDRYQPSISGPSGVVLSGDAIGGKVPGAIDLDLDDSDGTVFSDDTLPITAPDLFEFENTLMTVYFADEVHSYGLVGVDRAFCLVTSVEVIPEPATALSLMLGGLLITGYRRFFGRV